MTQPLLRRRNVARSRLFHDPVLHPLEPIGTLETLRPTSRRRSRPKLFTPRLLTAPGPRLCGLWPVAYGLVLGSLRRTTFAVQALLLRAPEQRRKRPFPHARPLGVTGHRGPPLPADGRRTPPCRRGRVSTRTSPSPASPPTAPSSRCSHRTRA